MAIHADNFEILRDCRALYLKQLRALLQDSALLSSHAIAAIQEGAGAYFDEVTASDRRASFAEEVSGLTASRITLLAEDDLALGIRLDNMTAHLFESTGGMLWKLHLRFVTLLRRPELPSTDNPVGPKSLCNGLKPMFSAAGASSLDEKLDLLDRIEAFVTQNLPALYAELNAFLDRAGVDAAQPAIVTSPDSPATAREVSGPVVSSTALQALQQALAAHLPTPQGTAGQGNGSAAAGLLSQSALEQLMFRLEALERKGRLGPPVIPGGASVAEPMMPALFSENAEPDTPRIIRSSELGIPKTATEGVAIDTLAMIFEAIMDHPELPDALKAVVASLQIKLLKVAMKDSTLFTDAAHPARQVIDRMAEAVLGLPRDVPNRHTVCVRLFELAAALRAEPGIDRTTCAATVTDLDNLIASRKTQIAETATAYQPLLDELDQRERVEAQVAAFIERCREARRPEVVARFIEQTWRPVLRQIGHEKGLESPAWLEYISAIDNLIWSLQPKADAEERRLLVHRIPAVVRVLKAGMEKAALPAAEQQTFLDTCFELQTLAMRAGAIPPAPAGETLSIMTPFPASTKPVAGQIEAGERLLTTLDYPEYVPSLSRVSGCSVGDSLRFQMADGTPQIAQVCAISASSGRVLLLNPERRLAVAIHPAILSSQMRNGEAAKLSQQSLFERAAEQALGKTARN